MRFTLSLGLSLWCCLALAGCDSGLANPAASALYGLWANQDSTGQWRVFEFAESSTEHPELAGATDVYLLSLYADGEPATQVQRGTYTVQEGHMVTHVRFDALGTNVGQSFANEIRGFGGGKLILESRSTTSGQRIFRGVSAYP